MASAPKAVQDKPAPEVSDDLDDFEISERAEVPTIRRSLRDSKYDKVFDRAFKNAQKALAKGSKPKAVVLDFKTREKALTRVQHLRNMCERRGLAKEEETGLGVLFTVQQRGSELYILCDLEEN